MFTLKFGKHKGKDVSQAPPEYLMWLIENTDINDPKYGAQNQALVDACSAALNARTDRAIGRKPAPARAPFAPAVREKTSVGKDQLIKDLELQIAKIYEAVTEAQGLIDVYNAQGMLKTQEDPY